MENIFIKTLIKFLAAVMLKKKIAQDTMVPKLPLKEINLQRDFILFYD